MPPKLHITIPLMDELEYLPVLLKCIDAQDVRDFAVYFCVNQPDAWWDDGGKREVCERNQQSMAYIREQADFPVKLIDRCSKGKGWQGKDHGVGWARKVVMDAASADADAADIIISLDGDTCFAEGYFRSVLDNFDEHGDAVGLSVPYYHKLCGREAEDRAILRYEIYMRHYAVNLWRIRNPYSYTALGSAMALPVKSYRAIGGMTPKKSGEDFYFLQKLVKFGRLLTWNREKVYPAARFSDRVFFGTGPAMIKGAMGHWDSYPIYHHSLFDDVGATYDAFPRLYAGAEGTPMDAFFASHMRDDDPWEPLRRNSRTVEVFTKACRDRIDGLRILQFLKQMQRTIAMSDEDCLLDFFALYHPGLTEELGLCRGIVNFEEEEIPRLDAIRNALAGIEASFQQNHHRSCTSSSPY
jgi:hypothetical protein